MLTRVSLIAGIGGAALRVSLSAITGGTLIIRRQEQTDGGRGDNDGRRADRRTRTEDDGNSGDGGGGRRRTDGATDGATDDGTTDGRTDGRFHSFIEPTDLMGEVRGADSFLSVPFHWNEVLENQIGRIKARYFFHSENEKSVTITGHELSYAG
ncbi:hypothetical protein BV898_19621 [Hypsibius exemplaris]|uniref:Uncharacterized protein n=1 Tax=Hypsibius exemplaris TaxID=2072580 RepID=A0A9X6RPA0_HYPEX|nr:hypothetical protein BV898_19621 [Hypsibius exemplaris]